MPALDQTIALCAGDTLQVTIPVRDADGSVPNLANAAGAWWAGDPPGSANARVFVRKATTPPAGASPTLALVQLPGGVWAVRFTLLPADTLGMPPGTHYHEAEVTDADGNRSTTTIGRFVLRGTIIRPGA